MNFRDITENVVSLPSKTSGVLEKLHVFYADQLPKPYWDEDLGREITDSAEFGSVGEVKANRFNNDEENAMDFDVRISFSKEPHDAIVQKVAQQIKEFGGIGLTIKPTRDDFFPKRTKRSGKVVSDLISTAMYFRDGQGYGMAVVSTWDVDEYPNPNHELHFRRRPRPH